MIALGLVTLTLGWLWAFGVAVDHKVIIMLYVTAFVSDGIFMSTTGTSTSRHHP